MKYRTVLALVLLMVTACGVPSQDRPTVIESTTVPFGLLQAAGDEPGPQTDDGRVVRARVYFVRDDALVGVDRALPVRLTKHRASAVMTILMSGPDPTEQVRGLGTAIPPTLRLKIQAVRGPLAVIDLAGDSARVTAAESPLTIAQIVLSVTSLPGIDEVRLTRDHEPLDAPRADGSLTAKSLTAEDYQSLRADWTQPS